MIPRITGPGQGRGLRMGKWKFRDWHTDSRWLRRHGELRNSPLLLSRQEEVFCTSADLDLEIGFRKWGKGEKILVQNCICKRRTEYRNPPILGVKFYTSSTSRVPKESLHLARINHEEQNCHVKKKFRRINFSALPNELICWVLISCLNSPLLTIISPHQILHHRCTKQLCGIA